jgi:hypothetical protein
MVKLTYREIGSAQDLERTFLSFGEMCFWLRGKLDIVVLGFKE